MESPIPQTSGLTGERAKKADMIVIWRPDHRRIHHNPGETESNQSRAARPQHSDTDGRSSAPPKRTRNKKKHRQSPSTATPQPAHADGPGDEKRRQQASECDMPRPTTVPQPRVKVDPDSPFAKLLELRSLLEGQANKRP
jgi:FtsZ-interacting cell division protein ZipA